MIILDGNGEIGKSIGDPARLIPAAHRKAVCKEGQDGVACRYLGKLRLEPNSPWACAKHTPLKAKIDGAVSTGVFIRNRGDNCEGLGQPSQP